MRRIGRGLIVRRTHLVAAHDVAMAGASFALALLLRYGFGSFWELSSGFIVEGMLLFAAVSALVFWRMRTYRGVWRYTALRDVRGGGAGREPCGADLRADPLPR